MTATTVFKHCAKAIKRGSLIKRVSATDKEYHFQNWFKARLTETKRNLEDAGRVQILCPSCGDIFPGLHGHENATCRSCGKQFKPDQGPAK
jgi:predicted RNA-binding Zn-ribbon protein involved in translation (DUF1610 family)